MLTRAEKDKSRSSLTFLHSKICCS